MGRSPGTRARWGRKGKSSAPRGVEGKGSWASPGKKCLEGESAGEETCVVCFCLWQRERSFLRQQTQHGDHRLLVSQPRLLRPAHVFGQNWKGCAQEVLVVAGFPVFQTSEIWLCRRDYLYNAIVGNVSLRPESPQKASCLQADGGTSPC